MANSVTSQKQKLTAAVSKKSEQAERLAEFHRKLSYRKLKAACVADELQHFFTGEVRRFELALAGAKVVKTPEIAGLLAEIKTLSLLPNQLRAAIAASEKTEWPQVADDEKMRNLIAAYLAKFTPPIGDVRAHVRGLRAQILELIEAESQPAQQTDERSRE